jgi:hypothetical protein
MHCFRQSSLIGGVFAVFFAFVNHIEVPRYNVAKKKTVDAPERL